MENCRRVVVLIGALMAGWARGDLPEEPFVCSNDVRAKRYAGYTDTVRTTIIPGYTRMYAVLAEKPGELAVMGPSKIVRGEKAVFSFGVAGTSGAQTFHAELVAPDGKSPVHFRRNFRSPDGRGEYDFETAFNEQPGVWKLLVRHVNTGMEREFGFEVR